jgi:hypothetical protein
MASSLDGLDNLLAVSLHNGCLVLVEGGEVKYPEISTPEWYAMSVKDQLISIIIASGHSLDDVEMERIEAISAEYDKPLEQLT